MVARGQTLRHGMVVRKKVAGNRGMARYQRAVSASGGTATSHANNRGTAAIAVHRAIDQSRSRPGSRTRT
jgi:hypothetical protein